ncbi:Leucine-rich repeat receptor protein kinase MSL1, partial [Mucuna pruriens]
MYLVLQVVCSGQEIWCIKREREALLQFKAALVDRYAMLSSWTTADCCQWKGVRCNNLTGHILMLDLHGESYVEYVFHSYYEFPSERYISGAIHKSLMELQQLRYLNLSWNSFPDIVIPEFLGSLSSLRYLDLSHSNFSGKIPSQFGFLSRLKYLNLGWNSLEGSIPYQLGNLSNLQHLDLRNNYFEGIIPSQLGNLSNLQKLYLGGYDGAFKIDNGNHAGDQWLSNLISLTHLYLSSFPNLCCSHSWLQMIGKLPKLRELSLIGCGLSDHFILSMSPSKFNFSTSLSVLDLSGNTFTSSMMIFQWVSNITSNLVELDLSVNYLEGSTSNHFGMFMNSLEHLDLSFNRFKSEVLKSFVNICTLHSLYMYENNLTENLPSILHNLSSGCVRYSLQELDLSYNQITGSLPDLSAFSSLKELDLDGNQLSGKIIEGVRLPSKLEFLSVSSNSLEGGVPKSFGSTCNLELLDLSYNNLNEELIVIFNHLSGCSSLRQLNLGSNEISGTLPNLLSMFPSLKRLYLDRNNLNGTISEVVRFPTELEKLHLDSNSLKGVITDFHFANMSKLDSLGLSDNSLTLAFTRDWVPPFQLRNIRLRSCKLGPTFPKWLQTQNGFDNIDISNAGISDVVPYVFWAKLALQEWVTMNISYNNLQGIIPNFPQKNPYYSLTLGSNQFLGPIPPFLRGSMSLDLSKNKFSDSLSFLCDSGTIETLYQLDLSNNQLSGQIPDCWSHFKSLAYLDLSHNKLSGTIPTSLGLLLDLQALLLRNNNLTDEIPLSLRSCTKLVMLDMAENRLSGPIPTWIGSKFQELQILSLGSNHFYGSLPLQICYLKSIQLLDVSINNLSGKIPKCITNFTLMAQKASLEDYYKDHLYSVSTTSRVIDGTTYYLNAFLTWKGSERMFTNNELFLLKSIDLSSNHFSEELPMEIGNLFELVSLNLSRNNLTGKIPSNIGKLTSLEFLDLSRNQFVGSIPWSLTQIDRLSMLDLSHNHLSGQIPIGTQLQGFNVSSYEDNLDLCGLPLKKLCIDGGPAQGPIVEVHEDENSLFTREFYMSMAIGFVTSFWEKFWILSASLLVLKNANISRFKGLLDIKEYDQRDAFGGEKQSLTFGFGGNRIEEGF